MKVYIVTKGFYSDYSIEAVFTSLRKAELYVAVRKNNEYSNEYDIDEFETDDEKITDKNEKIGYVFQAKLEWGSLRKGWIVPEHLYGKVQFEPNPGELKWYMIWLPENDPIKARKILQDRIAQHKAEIAGIL